MSLLRQLGLQDLNPGALWGSDHWSHASHTPVIPAINPATEEHLAQVQGASTEDYAQIMDQAQRAFLRWRQVPAPQRGELVRAIGIELRLHKEALGSLVTMETGKLKQEGDGEVQEMIDMADFATGQSRMLYGKTMHSERPQHRMYEQWHPLGVVGVITAFNFPVAVWAWNAFIAAIAGNTVVWKPSPQAPLTAIAVQLICNKVMAEQGQAGIFSLFIPAEVEAVQAMLRDPRLPLVSFTGSSAVGTQVAQTLAGRLGRSLLELSGNNAIILERSADLALAIPAIVFGAVGTTGQRCTSTRRLLVQESRLDEVGTALAHAYAQVRVGNPLDPQVTMGPLISAAAVQEFNTAVADLRQSGGEILYGGNSIDGLGHFVQATLARAENHWPVVQRETFAPLLYVIPYHDLDEAIALQNAVPQGLSSALFSQDLKQVERYLSSVGSDCGIANINIGTSGAEIGGAFGGEKATGGGREAGSDAWKAYMRRQTNTINWGDELPLAQGIEFRLE